MPIQGLIYTGTKWQVLFGGLSDGLELVNSLPEANFTFANTAPSLTVSFNGSSSVDPDGSTLTYSWSFGDGEVASGVTASRTYATAGSYNVQLTVTDPRGGIDVLSKTVTVGSASTGNSAPVAAFTAAVSNLTVNVNSSTSLDTDGSIVTRSWNWGDNSSSVGTPVTTSVVPSFDHVVVVVMENHSAGQIIGSSNAPYINSLANSGVNFTQSFGLTHPSQPNYIQLFSGSAQGVTDDGAVGPFTANNIARQILDAGKTWKAYSEDLPSVGFTGTTSGNYAKKHAPWASFSNVPGTLHVPFTQFPTDFTTLPALSFVIPNLINDMHDGSVNTGDTWLQQKLGAYATWATTHNSLLIVTFDEDDFTATNKIATVMYGANMKPGSYTQTIDHYSVLGFLEDVYALPRIAGAIGRAAITAPWTTTTSSTPATATTTLGPGSVTASHTYVAPGSYTIVLTATDDDGASSTASRRVSVVDSSSGDSFTLRKTKPSATNTGAGVSGNDIYGSYRVRSWPDSTNTTVVPTGDVVLKTAGQIYEGKHVVGNITIQADSITVRDCWVEGRIIVQSSNAVIDGNRIFPNHAAPAAESAFLVECMSSASNALIQFNSIYASVSTASGGWSGIGFRNFTAYRNHISNLTDLGGFAPAASGQDVKASFQGNYMHGPAQFVPDVWYSGGRAETHNDGIQVHGGSNGQIVGNTIMADYSPDSGTQPNYLTSTGKQLNMHTIMLSPVVGNITSLTVEDNWLDWGVYCVHGTQLDSGSSVAFRRNKFGRNMTKGYGVGYKALILNAAAVKTIGTGADANVFEDTITSTYVGDAVPVQTG